MSYLPHPRRACRCEYDTHSDVHYSNNIFKFGLMAKQADRRVVARFSVTAAIAARAGAGLLTLFD
jgi:hypothetical protein